MNKIPPIRMTLHQIAELLSLALLVTVVAVSPARLVAEQVLYLSSGADKAIVVYAVDELNGELTEQSRVALPGGGGALEFGPQDKFVYAAVGLPDREVGITTLSRDDQGNLKVLATAKITSRPAYLRVDPHGEYLFGAHYGTGEVTMWKLREGVCTDQLVQQVQTEKTAHCVEMDPSGQFVYVPHTTPNKVYQFKLDRDAGKLVANDPPFVDGPATDQQFHEPRHYAHHPTLDMAFTSNERGGGISAWNFAPRTGRLSLVQTLCTLPPGFEGRGAAADIQITPDGRFAYVSNRDATPRTEKTEQAPQDSIAAVAIDTKTGRMTMIGQYKTAHFPRSICIDGSGKFLYAAGQRSAELAAYRINPKTGALTHLQTYTTGGGPIWVECRKKR